MARETSMTSNQRKTATAAVASTPTADTASVNLSAVQQKVITQLEQIRARRAQIQTDLSQLQTELDQLNLQDARLCGKLEMVHELAELGGAAQEAR